MTALSSAGDRCSRTRHALHVGAQRRSRHGGERKSMSATHMGITSRPAYLSHFRAAVPRRSMISSKSKGMIERTGVRRREWS